MQYTVTEAGHMLVIGGKRRRAGDTVDLDAKAAQFEVLRDTVTEVSVEAVAPPKGKK